MSTIQKPGYGAYAAAPGRNSTFFNNPYMGQIANNLSSAIYGNPQDELVRERILTAQADRARQKEQDEIAATKRERESQAMGGLAVALPGMYREDGSIDGELWSNYVSENDLASIFTTEQMINLMPKNADFHRGRAEAASDHGFATSLQSHQAGLDLTHLGKEYGYETKLLGEKAKDAITLAGINSGLRVEEDKNNNRYDMLGSLFGDLTSRGGKNPALNAELADILDMDEFGNYDLYTSDGLEHGSEAAISLAEKKYGIDADEATAITELITGSLDIRPGDEGYTEVFREAMNLYADPTYNGDSSKVMAELFNRFQFQAYKKGRGIFRDTLPSATRIPSDSTVTSPVTSDPAGITTAPTRPNRDPAGIRNKI